MDQLKTDVPKLPNMVMCGDHPSITKTELNAKEQAAEDKEKEYEKDKRSPMSYPRISPTTSRDKPADTERASLRATSEHALRALAKQRRSLEAVHRPDVAAVHGNRDLVQAALGSFRWPPYLVCVWVVVLVLTHALHCVVGMLDRALPALRQVCKYFRDWTEDSWKREVEINQRIVPIALGCITALLYTLYCALVAVHGLALWAVEPLCGDMEDKPSSEEIPRVTNYVDIVASKPYVGKRQ
ncbi:uncharacterized protein LOC120630807 [Pararge aegeria]|uniref:Jg20225 protein n=1 Tax=Pararge aegeria aegeria TaxID=348720 RepID=A0A8S4R2E3_9NEOP|nr:uncharacterized protein LOC120630807 [Pararge aegeria]CAH2230013.1 jg20225 [Pararge aegeria aegeria]